MITISEPEADRLTIAASCVRAFAFLWFGAVVGYSQPQDPFLGIKKGEVVKLISAKGEVCEGNVTKRVPGSISVRLKQDTSACGAKKTTIDLTSRHVQTVQLQRRPKLRRLLIGLASAALVSAGAAVIMATESRSAGLPMIGAGVAIVGLADRDRPHLISLIEGALSRRPVSPWSYCTYRCGCVFLMTGNCTDRDRSIVSVLLGGSALKTLIYALPLSEAHCIS
jgi:hypothetical protein